MISIASNRHHLEVADTGITVIFGPTGVGKTTLLRQIAGHLPLQGSLVIGEDTLESESLSVRPQDRGFAYLSQSNSLIQQFSVKRNLKLAIEASRESITEQAITDICRICRIEHLLERRANQVSGGEAQQICLAMAMLSQPRLMLLDEPMSALDMRLKYDVLSQFKVWVEKRGIPVIYVSHDVNEIALVADSMAIISLEKPAEVRPYQAWLADVNSDFVTHSLAVNTLQAHYVRSDHDLNLMSLSGAPEITFWAQGEIEHDKDYVVELPITDISISLHDMPTSSILNQLKARIETISESFNGFRFVSLVVASQAITARLTAYSVQHLELLPGQDCYICFKTPRVLPLRQ